MEETDEAQLKPASGLVTGLSPGGRGPPLLASGDPGVCCPPHIVVAEGPKSHQSPNGSISMRLTAK